jgi:hypothetical protein
MRPYIKVQPTDDLPKSFTELEILSHENWKEHILSYVQEYYKETTNEAIDRITKRERKKKQAKIETAIKNHLYKWFKNNRKFIRNRFIINLEPRSEGKQEGYYDIKIQHSYWGNYPNKPYFPFECKNLGTSSLLNEYIFTETKD